MRLPLKNVFAISAVTLAGLAMVTFVNAADSKGRLTKTETKTVELKARSTKAAPKTTVSKGAAAKAAESPGRPKKAELKAVIEAHLSKKVDFKANDLLCLTDVEPILLELMERGITPLGSREELYEPFLTERDFLVQVFRSTAGKAFMRQVNQIPGAYDRLERLSWLPEGKEMIEQLIADPAGAETFKRLISPEGIKALEPRLASHPRGRNFSKPSGHIHTAAQLLSRLEKDATK